MFPCCYSFAITTKKVAAFSTCLEGKKKQSSPPHIHDEVSGLVLGDKLLNIYMIAVFSVAVWSEYLHIQIKIYNPFLVVT